MQACWALNYGPLTPGLTHEPKRDREPACRGSPDTAASSSTTGNPAFSDMDLAGPERISGQQEILHQPEIISGARTHAVESPLPLCRAERSHCRGGQHNRADRRGA